MSVNYKNREIMNKNIMKATIVAVVGLIAAINVFNSQKPAMLSDVAMANVEALAGDENGNVKLPCIEMENEYCVYTAELIDGKTQKRKEYGLMNYN